MKHRGRYVGILLLLLTLVIVGCSTDNSPTVSSEQATASSEQPITTLELATAQRTITYEDGNYIYVPEEDSRTFDEKSNILFFNDLLKVHLIQDISTEEKEAIAQSVNGSLVGNYNDGINFIQIEVPAFTLKEFKKIQKKLYQNSNIFAVRYETPVYCTLDSSIPADAEEAEIDGDWWINAINIEEVHSVSDYITENPTVGIIDSGFDTTSSVFLQDGQSKITMLNDNTPDDHGTAVAALVAGNPDNPHGIRGVAEKASLICADITTDPDNPCSINLSDTEIIVLTTQMIARGARVISNSWGSVLYQDSDYQTDPFTIALADEQDRKVTDITYKEYCDAFAATGAAQTMQYIDMIVGLLIQDKDFIIVQASGDGLQGSGMHEGYDVSDYGVGYNRISAELYEQWLSVSSLPREDYEDPDYDYRSNRIYYGKIRSHLLIVGAVGLDTTTLNDDEYITTSFTNYGDLIDVYAPGQNLRVLQVNDTICENASGTAYAASLVAGTAAYVWALAPYLSAYEVQDMIQYKCQYATDNTIYDMYYDSIMLDTGTSVHDSIMNKFDITVIDDVTKSVIEGVTCHRESNFGPHPLLDKDPVSDDKGEIVADAIGAMTITLSKEGYCDYSFEYYVTYQDYHTLGTIGLARPLSKEEIHNRYLSFISHRDFELYEQRDIDFRGYTFFDLNQDGFEELLLKEYKDDESSYEDGESLIFTFDSSRSMITQYTEDSESDIDWLSFEWSPVPTKEQAFENKIQDVRKNYNAIEDHPNSYRAVGAGDGTTYYFDSNQVVRHITAPAGTYIHSPSAEEILDYSAEYYYDEAENLSFVYVTHDKDEYRFYICNNTCIRYIDNNGTSTDYPDGVLASEISIAGEFCSLADMELHWAGRW